MGSLGGLSVTGWCAMSRLECESKVAQEFVDRYWTENLSVAELADEIVGTFYREMKWKKGVCGCCGHFDRLEPNFCPVCGAKAVR